MAAGCRSHRPRLSILLADGSCTLCANQYHVLVPLNAIYINAAGQGSQVRTVDRFPLVPCQATACHPSACQAAALRGTLHNAAAP